MSHTTVVRRGKALAAFTAVLGLSLSAAAVVGTPAAQSAPPDDCTAPYTVEALQAAFASDPDTTIPVSARSVTRGTTPQVFSGEVFGVLDDGIAPGLDMIMVDITPPDPAVMPGLKDVRGIWQGMSGSPVYADGKLVGAIAYGLSWGPSWVAGVTPFEEMDDYQQASAPAKIKVGSAQARAIARQSDVTAAQAAEGFSQLPMPTGVSGLASKRLAKAAQVKGHRWMPRDTYAIGSAAAPGDPGASPDTVVPGGNLAASLSYGDVTQAGIGTATSVCHGKVVGFGHPMTFLGHTTMSLHPANALYIQGETLGPPFKIANLGAPAGTIGDDHLTGITGAFGDPPAATDVSSAVTFLDRSRTGTSHVSVPEALASTTFFQLISNHDRVVDAITDGSELESWTVTGHEDNGMSHTFAFADRFASEYDITFEASFDLADFVYGLSTIEGFTVDDVSATSAVNDNSSVWRVSQVQQFRDGAWQVITRRDKVIAHAGKPVRLRALLLSGTTSRTVLLPVAIPGSAGGMRGQLEVTGGSYVYTPGSSPRTLAQAQKYIDSAVRNDEIQTQLSLGGEKGELSRTSVTGPYSKVVRGSKSVRVVVK